MTGFVLPPFVLILTYVVGGLVAVGLALCALRLKQLWWRIAALIVLVAAGVGYVASTQHLFQACLQGSYSNAAAPLDASRMLFFLQGYPARLVAIEAQTGTVRWQQQLSLLEDDGPLLVQNNAVYVPWSKGTFGPFGLRAYRASDGTVLWQTNVQDPADGVTSGSDLPLLLADGLLYAVAYRGEVPLVYALHTSDGTPAWKVQLNGFGLKSEFGHPMAAGGGLLFVSITVQGKLTTLAYRAQDGTLAWQAPLGSQRLFYAAGILLLQDSEGIHALRASTGAVLWTQPLGPLYPHDWPFISSAGQQVYVVASDPSGARNLYAIQAQTGTVLWSYPAGTSVGDGAAVEADGVVYYPAQTRLLELDAQDGHVLRSVEINSNSAFGAPVVMGQVVLVQSHLIYPHESYQCPGDHEPTDALFALHAPDGSIYWRYQTSGAGWDVVGDA